MKQSSNDAVFVNLLTPGAQCPVRGTLVILLLLVTEGVRY